MPSARVTCPYCQAKLRLATDGGTPTRAKCRTCGKTFVPTFTEPVQGDGALYLDASIQNKPLMPLTPFGTPPPPSPAPVVAPPPQVEARAKPPEPARPLFEFSSSSPAAVAAPPAPPPAVKAEPRRAEPEIVAPPAPARIVEVPHPEPEVVARPPAPVAVLAPPPPKVVPPPAPIAVPPPAPAKAPAKRKVERHKRKDGGIVDFSRDRLRPFEIALGVVILLAAAAGAGLLWYQYSGPSGTTAVADGSGEESGPVDETATPEAAAMVDLESGQKPRPPELFGTWALRADDGRVGQLVLYPDGGLIASSSTLDAGDKPFPDYEGHWYFIHHVGDRYTLEFGSLWHGPDSYRVVLEMTGPDALTLVETVKNGAPVRDQHRFIRIGPPTKKSAG